MKHIRSVISVSIISSIVIGLTHAATVRVHNKWDKTIVVTVLYSDKGVTRTFFSAVTSDFPISGKAIERSISKEIKPGESAYFDSGLNPITSMQFSIDGSPSITFNPDIGSWSVEQKVIFYNPTDIRRIK